MIEECYIYPWEVFKKYFPEGTEEEFNEAFISFDLSEKEFLELASGNLNKYVCWDTVMFDLTKISAPLNKKYEERKIPYIFRKS